MTTTQTFTTKPVATLAVGDVVYGIGNVTFDEPHTVTKVDGATLRGEFKVSAIIATGGCFWPAPMMGQQIATIAA